MDRLSLYWMDQWEQSPVGTTLGTMAGQLSSRPITDDTLLVNCQLTKKYSIDILLVMQSDTAPKSTGAWLTDGLAVTVDWPVYNVSSAVHLLDNDGVEGHGIVIAAEWRLFLGTPLVDVPLHRLVALVSIP